MSKQAMENGFLTTIFVAKGNWQGEISTTNHKSWVPLCEWWDRRDIIHLGSYNECICCLSEKRPALVYKKNAFSPMKIRFKTSSKLFQSKIFLKHFRSSKSIILLWHNGFLGVKENGKTPLRNDNQRIGIKKIDDDNWHCIYIFNIVGGGEARNWKGLPQAISAGEETTRIELPVASCESKSKRARPSWTLKFLKSIYQGGKPLPFKYL